MTVTTPVLRPYQKRAVDAIFAGWDAGITRVAISASTGSGKSVVFGAVARRHLSRHRGAGPVVLLAHRRELITQAAGHFRQANPDLRVETVIGSPGKQGSQRYIKAMFAWRSADVLVTTVQTLASNTTRRIFPDPSLVIADEAHHAAANQWKNTITALGGFSGTRCLGVTATPFREDHRDFSDVWEHIVAAIDIGWLIGHRSNPVTGEEEACPPGQGYLVPPRLRHLSVDGLDLSSIPTSQLSGAVDFRDHELAEAMQEAGAFEIVAKAVVTELPGRKGVIFAPTVASSKHLAQRLTELGAPCHHVDGTMAIGERDRVIGDFSDNRVRWLSNVGIVSEGFDIPEIDTVVLARPTRSRIFFRQAVGRALRPAAGKDHAIVLDVVGASEGHSLAGVEALTDTSVLKARCDESISELIARSDRARQGTLDRIAAHRHDAQLKQAVAERLAEQIRITSENFSDKLPGLAEFSERSTPTLEALVAVTSEVVTLAEAPGVSLDDLVPAEERCAQLLKNAGLQLAELDKLRVGLRTALQAIRQEPASPVARAMVTGYVGLVAGDLFGAEEARIKPGAPKDVHGFKLRQSVRTAKPTFAGRYGWLLTSDDGHVFIPIHVGRDIARVLVAIRVLDTYGAVSRYCVEWDTVTGEADWLSPGQMDDEPAHALITNRAAELSESTNLINPQAAWRKKPASDSQFWMARRSCPQHQFPDRETLTAGYVSDVITYGRYNVAVNRLAEWVRNQAGDTVKT